MGTTVSGGGGGGISQATADTRYTLKTGPLSDATGTRDIGSSGNLWKTLWLALTGLIQFGGGNSIGFSNGTGPVFQDSSSGVNWTLDTSGLTSPRTVTIPDAAGVMTLLGNNKSGTGSIVLTSTPTITTPVLTTPTLNGMKTGVTAKTADYTLATADVTVTVDATAGNVTITLPAAAIGQLYRIKRIDASGNTVTVARAGSDTIDGATSVTLTTQWQAKMIQGLTQSPGGTWGVF